MSEEGDIEKYMLETLKVVTAMKIVTNCDICHTSVTSGHVSHISVTFVTKWSHMCDTVISSFR